MFTPKTKTAYVVMINNEPAAITWAAKDGAIAVDVYGSVENASQLYCVSTEEGEHLTPVLISSDYSWAAKMADRIYQRSNCPTWIDRLQIAG